MQVSRINGQLSVMPGRKDGGISAESFLREKLLLPNGFVRKLFSAGRVKMQGHVIQDKDILKSGQKIWLEGDSTDCSLIKNIPDSSVLGYQELPSILFEDNHVLIVDKPANLIVHAPKSEERETLDTLIARYYAKTNQSIEPFHIHRLDKGTTGALMYGKHDFILRALDEELRSGRIKRTYLALTFGKGLQRKGMVNAAIGRDRHQAGKYRVSLTGKDAVTKYTRISQRVTKEGTYSLVACRLVTGRTHQIRVHLASLGAPIVGDHLYGGKVENPFTNSGCGIGLHACSIRFFHPYDEIDIDVFAPLPSTFVHLFSHLGFIVPDMDNNFLSSLSI